MQIEQFRRAAGLTGPVAERWFSEVTEAMAEFGIDTPALRAAFIAQVGTESGGFTRLSESFNYSTTGLVVTFHKRITLAQAGQLGRQPGETAVPMTRQMQIADLVYGGRYGNSSAGDGWKFRGRGLKQVTFRDNYEHCGEALGLDLLNNPDLLLTEENAARSAAWFWHANECNRFADANDIVGLTRRINGGINGLADRKMRWEQAKLVLRA